MGGRCLRLLWEGRREAVKEGSGVSWQADAKDLPHSHILGGDRRAGVGARVLLPLLGLAAYDDKRRGHGHMRRAGGGRAGGRRAHATPAPPALPPPPYTTCLRTCLFTAAPACSTHLHLTGAPPSWRAPHHASSRARVFTCLPPLRRLAAEGRQAKEAANPNAYRVACAALAKTLCIAASTTACSNMNAAHGGVRLL